MKTSRRSKLSRRNLLKGGLLSSALLLETPGNAVAESSGSITDVAGLKVGQFTDKRRPTGCTVILAEEGAVGGADVRGGAPGTRETDLLDPLNTVNVVHAICLAGGSAFGLDVATGVMRYLEERGVGLDTRAARIPIVPAAILYDLRVGDAKIRPDAEAGYRACQAASTKPPDEGNFGAGAGATVGKLFGMERAMKGGLGTSSIKIENVTVAALVAVNALGDVIDPSTARIVAGARTVDGKKVIGAIASLLRGEPMPPLFSGTATTIGVVATDAILTKIQAAKVAQMAHDGVTRAINPAHTSGDGDTIFSLATGKSGQAGNVSQIGALAAEAMSRAIVRAVRAARGLPGLPSASDLGL